MIFYVNVCDVSHDILFYTLAWFNFDISMPLVTRKKNNLSRFLIYSMICLVLFQYRNALSLLPHCDHCFKTYCIALSKKTQCEQHIAIMLTEEISQRVTCRKNLAGIII